MKCFLVLTKKHMHSTIFFLQHNNWLTDREDVEFIVCKDTYVDACVQSFVSRDVLLCVHTDGEERMLSLETFSRLVQLIPDTLAFDSNRFFIGKKEIVNSLRDISRSDCLQQITRFCHKTQGSIRYVNFIRRGIMKEWAVIYQEQEGQKVTNLLHNLKNTHIILRSRQKLSLPDMHLMFSKNINKHVVVSVPPNKCDILILRASLLDAMPDETVKKMAKIVIHIGARKQTNSHADITLIDGRALQIYDPACYMKQMHDFLIRSFNKSILIT